MDEKTLLKHFELKINEAINLKRKKKYSEAIEVYKSLFAIDPNVPAVHKGMAKVCAASGKYNDAVECFRFAAMLYNRYGDSKEAALCMGYSEVFSNPDPKDPQFLQVLNAVSG